VVPKGEAAAVGGERKASLEYYASQIFPKSTRNYKGLIRPGGLSSRDYIRSISRGLIFASCLDTEKNSFR